MYVIRCYVCHHKMGTADSPHEQWDVCDRCERDEQGWD